MKKLLYLAVALAATQYAVERFVLQAPGSDKGFIPVGDGFGMDDAARIAAALAAVLLVNKLA